MLSWEPVRYHDVVDMGWSTLADLSIYEGKLLDCSDCESRVGVWVADISVSVCTFTFVQMFHFLYLY